MAFGGVKGVKQEGSKDLTIPEMACIDKLFEIGETKKDIAGHMNKNRSTITRYLNHKTYTTTNEKGERASTKNKTAGGRRGGPGSPDDEMKNEANELFEYLRKLLRTSAAAEHSGQCYVSPATVIHEWNRTHEDPWPWSEQTMRRIVYDSVCEDGCKRKRLPMVRMPLARDGDAETRWAWCKAQVPRKST